ncbi:MAG: cytochrome c [Myxococcota bacterium]|nr:cytochrome c [Myxococcota bacterium]
MVAARVGAEPPSALPLFARQGEPVASPSMEALLGTLRPQRVTVMDPYEKEQVEFLALDLAEVFDAVYSPAWREEEEIVFTCLDGYQPVIPVARVKAHSAWLAFARNDQAGFTILKNESGERKTIELAPYYVIWENLDDPQIRMEADYGWPYQLKGVDLVRSQDRFSAMTPSGEAPPPVQAGFAAFRVHCLHCHKVNGVGGQIGPELNAGLRPAMAREQAWLRQWIGAPDQIRPNTRMPALNPGLPEREQTIDALIAYLQFMAAMPAAREEP